MSPDLEELLHSSFILKQTLSKVLSPEAVNYIMELIAKDGAHRKYLQLTEETDEN
jgi:hypothetical protein